MLKSGHMILKPLYLTQEKLLQSSNRSPGSIWECMLKTNNSKANGVTLDTTSPPGYPWLLHAIDTLHFALRSRFLVTQVSLGGGIVDRTARQISSMSFSTSVALPNRAPYHSPTGLGSFKAIALWDISVIVQFCHGIFSESRDIFVC